MTRLFIIASPEREEAAWRLHWHLHQRFLNIGIDVVTLMDWERDGATENHCRALQSVGNDERIIVLEDDALPVNGFRGFVTNAIALHPDDLLSFYLGASAAIAQVNATSDESEYIENETLLHGVAYTIPAGAAHVNRKVNELLESDPSCPIDRAIGQAWRELTGRRILHRKRSLVEHADGPSLIHTEPREPRRAWALAAPIHPEFEENHEPA